MKVLVAGASGFIGSAVTLALREAGHAVVAVSRSQGRLPTDVPRVTADVGAAPLDPAHFEGLDAVVNLVGIAIERGDNTFEAAHVDAVEHLLALSAPRFVHVSVVRPDSSDRAYFRTKREGEARVRDSGVRWTILRPGLVYGPGDAMLSNLVRFVRLAPLFAAPGGETGPLQTVDVLDVAAAVVRTLQDEDDAGSTIDVVGPERFTLTQLVRAVGRALALPTAVARLPQPLMKLAAAAMDRVLPNPPITPTQLGMLIDGLYGDVEQTRDALGREPRTLDDARIREVARDIDGPSLRLLPSAEAHQTAGAWDVPWFFPFLAVAALLAGPWIITDLWLRMLVLEGALVGVLALLGAPLRSWLRPRAVALGLLSAAVMLLGGAAVIAGLRPLAPELMAGTTEVHGWASTWPPLTTLVMLPLIAGAEDLVWRFGITLGLVRRLGPAMAVVLGGLTFALAHLTTGPPILAVAALLAGLAWSALALRTQSWLPVVLCHVLWDAGILVILGL